MTSGKLKQEVAVQEKEAKAMLRDYRKKDLAGRVGFGRSPAVLVVDFMVGFTELGSPLAAPLEKQLNARQVYDYLRFVVTKLSRITSAPATTVPSRVGHLLNEEEKSGFHEHPTPGRHRGSGPA